MVTPLQVIGAACPYRSNKAPVIGVPVNAAKDMIKNPMPIRAPISLKLLAVAMSAGPDNET